MMFILMGVTGSGKTTIGKLLASALGAVFEDADDLHTDANKAKMAAGTPLTDADRAPWLDCLNQLLLGWQAAGVTGVLACSALKQQYRETMLRGMRAGEVQFVLLEDTKSVLEERLANRHGHYMNPALLDSQIATLEQPGVEVFRACNDGTPEQTLAEILARFRLGKPKHRTS